MAGNKPKGGEFMKLCDLHTHSVFSDGTLTPTEIIDTALQLGLSAVALTDHNNIDGLPELLAAAKDKPITAIPGAEFSVDYNGQELHLLGLYLPESSFPRVSELMDAFIARKRQSNMDLVNALKKAGYEIDFDAIVRATPNGKINRAHIAAALTQKGYTESIKQAFSTLLAPGAGYYIEPKYYTLWEMLDFITAIGAVPVLAHPFLHLNEQELDALLPLAKQAGLAGMECQYVLYDEKTTKTAFALADKYGLAYSGGSDFHGDNKPDIALGSGKGNLKVPLEWAEKLAKTAE